MTASTNDIRPAILCFGETLLRLSPPGNTSLFQTPALDAHFGGAEANVAVGLARLGVPVAMATVLPDDRIGLGALDHMRRSGVEMARAIHRPGRLGLYFLQTGAGLRAASIVYDRTGSVFAQARPDDFDWSSLFDGCGWFHLSGITPALGPDSADLALHAVKAARAAGLKISFDGNFRAQLWARWNANPAPILRDLVREADLLFGNHRDLSLMLDRDFSGAGEARRRESALAGFEAFPNLRWIASTARHVEHVARHRLAGRVDTRERAFATEEMVLDGIVDRIGGGDAFAAGVLAGLVDGEQEAVELGLALAVLKHYTPGDASMATRDEVAALRAGGLDVRR